MAEITKPIALDETFNTTSSPSQNLADVLKGGLYDIAQAIGSGSSVSWNQIQASGDKIAEVTINGTTTDVYSPSVSGKADNSIIAPVLTTFQATATVKDKGTQFIYNGVLYEITTSVTAGTSFVVGTNVKVADTITEKYSIKELDASTLITPYNSTVTIKNCKMYQQEDVITIECAVEVSTAIANSYVISINSAYRPAELVNNVTNAVGPCVARLTSLGVGATHVANAWVVSGNVFITVDTACKAFMFTLQYRKA